MAHVDSKSVDKLAAELELKISKYENLEFTNDGFVERLLNDATKVAKYARDHPHDPVACDLMRQVIHRFMKCHRLKAHSLSSAAPSAQAAYLITVTAANHFVSDFAAIVFAQTGKLADDQQRLEQLLPSAIADTVRKLTLDFNERFSLMQTSLLQPNHPDLDVKIREAVLELNQRLTALAKGQNILNAKATNTEKTLAALKGVDKVEGLLVRVQVELAEVSEIAKNDQKRLGKLNRDMEGVQEQLNNLNEKLVLEVDKLEKKMEENMNKLEKKMEERMDNLEKKMGERMDKLEKTMDDILRELRKRS